MLDNVVGAAELLRKHSPERADQLSSTHEQVLGVGIRLGESDAIMPAVNAVVAPRRPPLDVLVFEIAVQVEALDVALKLCNEIANEARERLKTLSYWSGFAASLSLFGEMVTVCASALAITSDKFPPEITLVLACFPVFVRTITSGAFFGGRSLDKRRESLEATSREVIEVATSARQVVRRLQIRRARLIAADLDAVDPSDALVGEADALCVRAHRLVVEVRLAGGNV